MRRAAIERLLPSAYQRAAQPPGLLAALLAAMESLHAPSEEILGAVDDLFTPYRCPDPMVVFLLGWIAFDHVLQRDRDGRVLTSTPLGRLRNLLAGGADLARKRGTAAGLLGVVETVTGVAVELREPADHDFHIVVAVPAAAASLLPLITRLVEAEKPAAVTAEVRLEGGEAT